MVGHCEELLCRGDVHGGDLDPVGPVCDAEFEGCWGLGGEGGVDGGGGRCDQVVGGGGG